MPQQAMRFGEKEKTWLYDEDLQSLFAAEAKLPEQDRKFYVQSIASSVVQFQVQSLGVQVLEGTTP